MAYENAPAFWYKRASEQSPLSPLLLTVLCSSAMDFDHHLESRLTYQGLDDLQPLAANLPQEPHQLPGPESHCVLCGNYLGASPVQNAVVYGPAVGGFPIQDGDHPFLAERELPVGGIAYPTEVSPGQPQYLDLSYLEEAEQPAQSCRPSVGEIVEGQEQSQSHQQQIPRDLVPQVPYRSTRRFPASDNIEFMVNGESGIRLSDALDDRWAGFGGRDDKSLFDGNRQQVMLRFQPTGCLPWHSKINITDFRMKPRPISRARLAAEVAKSMRKFIAREKKCGHDAGHPRCHWGDIELKNIFLSRLVRVSVASWQPEILVERVSASPHTTAPASSSLSLLA